MSHADPQSSAVEEAGGFAPGSVRSLAIGAPGGLREPAGALDVERAEAIIFQVADECRRCPVNRSCPGEICRWYRLDKEAQAALDREGVASPVVRHRGPFHVEPDPTQPLTGGVCSWLTTATLGAGR